MTTDVRGGEGRSVRTDGPSVGDRAEVDLSVVLPAKDEAESIPVLAGEIEAVLDRTGWSWECVWIDDGSGDGTLDQLRRLQDRRTEHRWISFERNYGQAAAFLAGFERARGAILVSLDADLQNDPQDIPRLVEEVRSGRADLATGVRARRDDPWIRRASSQVANRFRNRVTGDRIRDVGCSLRALRRECARQLPAFHGMHRFLPTLVRIEGYRVVELEVSHRGRRFGRTKYGIGNRLWVGLGDTLMVWWLARRRVRPVWRRTSEEDPGRETARSDQTRQGMVGGEGGRGGGKGAAELGSAPGASSHDSWARPREDRTMGASK